MQNFDNLFKGFDQRKVAEAIKQAKILVNDPDVKKAFSGVSKSEMEAMLSKLDAQDKDKLIDSMLKSDNNGISELIKKIKQN